MSVPLLLDEMFSDPIARQLRTKHHDVLAVVADAALAGLADDQIFARAAASGRALVTPWQLLTGDGKIRPGQVVFLSRS